MKILEIDYTTISKLLYYDETSPSGLRWKVDIRSGKGIGRLVIQAGSCAGTLIKPTGGFRVCINNKRYLAHRIIYCLHNGHIPPDLEIDHIDGNRNNNVISNLRLVNDKTNCQNRKMRFDNESGKTGISLIHSVNGNKDYRYWMARWQDTQGKTRSKLFSINKYGDEGAYLLACKYRDKMLAQLRKQGEFYTERHGCCK